MVPQPRHALELERVRGLVQRHPAQELVRVGLQVGDRLLQVRGHEEQPRRRRGVQQHELVLPEHVAGHVPEEPPDLGRHDDAGHGAHRPGERAELGAQALLEGLDQRSQAADVGLDPAPPAERLRAGQRSRRAQTRIGADQPLALRGGGGKPVEPHRRGRAVGALACDEGGDLSRQAPVDHRWMMTQGASRPSTTARLGHPSNGSRLRSRLPMALEIGAPLSQRGAPWR